MKRVFIGLLVSLFATGVFANDAIISVTGNGQVSVVPDMATITMGVTTQGETAQGAMADNSAIMSGILETLKQEEIATKDVQTTDINLSPVWNRQQNNGLPPEISGYQASNNVTVVVRDLEKLGSVLDRISKTGANNFHGIQFDLIDRKPALDQARVNAVNDARAKAELYATAAGVNLGKVMEISESMVSASPRGMRMAEAMSASMVPVSQGSMEISAQISIVFALGD
jgi:uncharacterized protein YggE